MNIIKKIIDSVNFLKKKNVISKIESKCQNYLCVEKYINNTREAYDSMNFSLSKLHDAYKIPNGSFKKNNEAIENQIKALKNITLIFEKIMINIKETRICFSIDVLTEELKVLDNDLVVIEKIYLFLGSVKDDESLIGKLFYAKQKKDMKRKKYVLNNQINRLKSKLNNLNEIVTKIEKIYLDKI